MRKRDNQKRGFKGFSEKKGKESQKKKKKKARFTKFVGDHCRRGGQA